MKDLRVSFPKPCSERWEDMAPRGCDRHCDACDQVIYDLAVMTVEEVEQLVANEPEPCVKATIDAHGSLKLSAHGSSKTRKAFVAVGAACFALAACQTPQIGTLGSIRGRITVGEESGGPDTIRARDANGKIFRAKIERNGRDASYSIQGLPAGNYSLSFSETSCSNGNKLKKTDDVKVEGREVDLGTMDWDTLCVIYIGMMTLDHDRRG